MVQESIFMCEDKNHKPNNIVYASMSMRNDNKLSIKLPDGDFEYEIIKGEGIQDIAIRDKEIFECSQCDTEYYGDEGYGYYENDILCMDCFVGGDDLSE